MPADKGSSAGNLDLEQVKRLERWFPKEIKVKQEEWELERFKQCLGPNGVKPGCALM